HPLQVCCNNDSGARISDQIPTNEVCVAAVKRIRECALDGVCADEIEELARITEAGGAVLLQVRQNGILIYGRQPGEWRAFGRLSINVQLRQTRCVRRPLCLQ